MARITSFVGRCHCGNVEVTFETATPPAQLEVRACACSFCRRHGARTMTDRHGRAHIVVRDPGRLNRYRFGLRTADFLVCGACGVYLGAVFTDGEDSYATLNVNAFEERDAFPQAAAPVQYGGETEAGRRSRRKASWTPVVVVEG